MWHGMAVDDILCVIAHIPPREYTYFAPMRLVHTSFMIYLDRLHMLWRLLFGGCKDWMFFIPLKVRPIFA